MILSMQMDHYITLSKVHNKRREMKKLKINIEFECLSDKLETEETLNKIINYQIYEKIWNISNNGVKLKITEKENEQK